MDAIERLESDPRVLVRRKGAPDPDGRCVVYWMRRSLRGVDNPALEAAIAAANALAKPVVVLFALIPVANANLRHYTFMVQALAEIQEDLGRRNVGLILRRYPDHSVAKFCGEAHAALLVTDENPLRGLEQRLTRVGRGLPIPVWSVDSDDVVPSRLIDKKQYAARIIRPQLRRLRDDFLVKPKYFNAHVRWSGRSKSPPVDASCLDGLEINRSVQPVPMKSGSKEAVRLLRDFTQNKLASYPKQRNHPETNGTSHPLALPALRDDLSCTNRGRDRQGESSARSQRRLSRSTY